MKILLVGDIHFRNNTPRSRVDDITVAMKDKFKQISAIIEKNDVKAVVCTGDIFDSAKVPNETLLISRDLFSSLNVPIYSIIGNHDMIGNSIENHRYSSLNILEMICLNFTILKGFDNILEDKLQLIGKNYGDKSYNTSINGLVIDNIRKMIISHTMVVDSPTMFESTSIEEVLSKTDADFVLVGHNHKKFYKKGLNSVGKECQVYNPGALLRLTVADGDYNREVEVGLFDIDNFSLERITLNTNINSFNLEEINERKEAINEALESFLEISTEGIRTVEDILLEIATLNKVDKDIVNKALQKLKKT